VARFILILLTGLYLASITQASDYEVILHVLYVPVILY